MNIVIVTGAGISQESGIPTFRGEGGLWNGPDAKYLSRKSLQGDFENTIKFYDRLRMEMLSKSPNAAHVALAELQKKWPGKFTLITQNIDTLHEQAGSINVIH